MRLDARRCVGQISGSAESIFITLTVVCTSPSFVYSIAFFESVLGGMPSILSLIFVDNAAGDFCARVASGLGVEIVASAVDNHGPAKDVPHPKTVRPYCQKRPAMARQQGRQIPGVLGMGLLIWVIVTLCVREALASTAAALVDMQGKES